MTHQTALLSQHEAEGGKIVDFAGWRMPLQYESITREHQAVREEAGVFDVGHMGRFFLDGPAAAEGVSRLVVSRIDDMNHGQTRYTLVCNEQGCALDDILVNRLADDQFLLVVNASNREKLASWFNRHLPDAVLFQDKTLDTGMIAVQGPKAEAITSQVLDISLSALGYYNILMLDGGVYVSRTGYTGEDGFEIIAPNDQMEALWKAVRAAGASPAGLGARDSLRLEMGFPLYGHELSEEITPLEAVLKRVVHLDKSDFIGKEALEAQLENGVPRKRIGFVLTAAGVPRQGYQLYDGDSPIGEVTSGGYSTVLKKGIGLALVAADHVKPENLSVDIRGKKIPAEKTKPPFVEKRVKV